MGKYHYEYYLVCVDLCNGGAKRGPYRSIQNAKFDSHFLRGIWHVKKSESTINIQPEAA